MTLPKAGKRDGYLTTCVGALAATPWLNFFSPAPSASVVGILLSAVCLVLLIVLQRANNPDAQSAGGPGLPTSLAWGWLAAALISSTMALAQFFGSADSGAPWVSASGGVAYANLRQRNQFASLTAIGLAALLYLTARVSLPRSTQSKGTTPVGHSLATALALALALAAALLMAGNAASASRTGLFEVLMLCGLSICWRPSLSGLAKALMLLAPALYLFSAWALPWLAGLAGVVAGDGSTALSRLAAGDLPCSSRLTLWSNVLHLIVQKPWLGWGWGELDYAHYVTLYPGERFCAILDNAHNLPLHLAVELGVPVALMACLGMVVGVWRARPWAERDAGRQLGWAVLAVLGLHSLLEYPLWYGPFLMALLLSLWLLWRRTAAQNVYKPFFKQNRALALTGTALSAIFVIAFIAYAAWDYWRIGQIYRPVQERAVAYREDTLRKIAPSWLFAPQVRFAELTTTPLTPDNAAEQASSAAELLHFSPEPRVIERLIESLRLLGLHDRAAFHAQRYQAAFPENYRDCLAASESAANDKAQRPP